MQSKIKTFYVIWINLKCVLFTLLGLLCGFYFLVCILYGGIRLSWIWIWPLLTLFFFARVFFLCRERKLLLFEDPQENDPSPIENSNQKVENTRKDIRKGKAEKTFTAILRIAYRILFLLTAGLFLPVESRIIHAMNTQEKDNLTYVIVLGAGLKGSVPTRPLLLRMEKAYEYMVANPDTILIASGGQGPDEDISEGECIKNYLTTRGIEEKRILVEKQSTSTEENIAYSFAMLPENEGEVGILSNSFHIYRAVRIAKLQGHENVSGVPAKTLLPLGIHYTVREFFGCVKLMLSS